MGRNGKRRFRSRQDKTVVHDIQRQAGELDEIDGIMIEAFAYDDMEVPPAPAL